MPTQEKVETIEDLKTRLRGVKTVLLTEYRGLSVAQLSELRKQLRSVSAEYKIVKNRLARLALSPDLSAVGTYLKGPTGMILSREDAVAVAKTLHTFAKTNTALVIKAGYVEGQMLPPDGLKALADLPSKDALRSAIVGALQGPLAQLVGLLRAPQRDLVYVLEQRGKMAPPAAAPAAAASTEAAPATAASTEAAPAEAAAPSA